VSGADLNDWSTVGRKSRRRGADAERAVVAFLREQGWPDARRYLAGDGRQPGDLDWVPIVVLEVKDVASSAWPAWCRQAAAVAGEHQVPVVVRRTRGVPDVGAWKIRARWIDWMETFGSPTEVYVEVVEVDGRAWLRATMADLVAAVRGVDQ